MAVSSQEEDSIQEIDEVVSSSSTTDASWGDRKLEEAGVSVYAQAVCYTEQQLLQYAGQVAQQNGGVPVEAVLPQVIGDALAQAGLTKDRVDQAFTDANIEMPQSKFLRDSITEENLRAHLERLEVIAQTNGNNRASGTRGMEQTLLYVEEKLESYGYEIDYQAFFQDIYYELPNSVLKLVHRVDSFVKGQDFKVVKFSPPGIVDEGLVEPIEDFGCDVDDYLLHWLENNDIALENNDIALGEDEELQADGGCEDIDKILLAQSMGYVGVLIYNKNKEVDERSTAKDEMMPKDKAHEVNIPVFSISFNKAEELILLNQKWWEEDCDVDDCVEPPPTIDMVSDTERNFDSLSWNVFAETPYGNADQTIVIGSHMDSGRFTPGINDNGSAVAANLELARHLAGQQTKNKIVFAFWAGEERGLLGSKYYINELVNDPIAKSKIQLYFNMEMLASDNYVRGIYPVMSEPADSDQARLETAVANTFLGFYFHDSTRIRAIVAPPAYVPALKGRSDHYYFLTKGNIPSSGVITGANLPKTEALARCFGGTVDADMATCYHKTCDTVATANTVVMHEVVDSYAHALWVWANKDTIAA